MLNEAALKYGFEWKRETEFPEYHFTLIELEHKKTGAKVGWIRNNRVEKALAIAFKTLPFDDTGVFHIIEHCVLDGAEHYPIRSLSDQLRKGSFSTEVNAFTAAEKTVYELSSIHETELLNLFKVYLDCVFYPLITKNENAFLQEGYRYEMKLDGTGISLNGVVLNEMLGYEQNIHHFIIQEVKRALFPDTTYQYANGGIPDQITQLSYETFLSVYRKFYHPSNAYIMLEGDLDLVPFLKYLNEVLSAFDRQDMELTIEIQKPVETVDLEITAPIYPSGYEEGNLVMAFVIPKYQDVKSWLAASILCEYLCGSTGSPFHDKLVAADYSDEIGYEFFEEMKQPFLLFDFPLYHLDDRKKAERIFRETMEELKQNGMHKESLLGILSRLEFFLTENQTTGMNDIIGILKDWICFEDPLLEQHPFLYVDAIREEIESGTFVKYLDEFFLQNPHRTSILFRLDGELLKEQKKKKEIALQSLWNSWDDQKKAEMYQKQIHFQEWQSNDNGPDPETILPRIKLSDLAAEPYQLPMEILEDKTFWHKEDTNGIHYVRLLFDISDFSTQEIQDACMLTRIIGTLPIKSDPGRVVSAEKQRYFGEFTCYLDLIEDLDAKKDIQIYYVVEFSYLARDKEVVHTFVRDLLLDQDLRDANDISELLFNSRKHFRERLVSDGVGIVKLEAARYSSERKKLEQLLYGRGSYRYLEKSIRALQEDSQAFIRNWEDMIKRIFLSERLSVSITSDEKPHREKESWVSLFPSGEPITTHRVSFCDTKQKQQENGIGFLLDTTSPCVALAGRLKQNGQSMHGSWYVFSNIVTMNYLLSEIREKGGAYAAYLQVNDLGNVCFYSYRDPHPEVSLKVFLQTADHMISEFEKMDTLDEFKISTIADMDMVIEPEDLGGYADANYLANMTQEKRCRVRAEIMQTTKEDLLSCTRELKELLPHMTFCMIGTEEMYRDLSVPVEIIDFRSGT